MKLMTKELEKRFAQVGSQAEEKDPLIIGKFSNPCGAGIWYAFTGQVPDHPRPIPLLPSG